MQCTLFGATGFLGWHVAEQLVTSGHAVTACAWFKLKDVLDTLRGTPSKVQRLPATLAYALARVLEWTTPYSQEPMLTGFVVRLLTTPHLYDDSKLRATGFVPPYGLDESIARLVDGSPAPAARKSSRASFP